MHLVNLKHLALRSFSKTKRQWSIRANLMIHASFRLISICICPKTSNVRQQKMLILRQKKCRRIRADELLTPSDRDRMDRISNIRCEYVLVPTPCPGHAPSLSHAKPPSSAFAPVSMNSAGLHSLRFTQRYNDCVKFDSNPSHTLT